MGHRSAANVNMNIIPPVDLGTHAPNGGGYHRIRGFIDSITPHVNAPDWCVAAAGGGDRTSCGGNLDSDCTASDPVQSPWPYLHFMASEIVSIQAVCNTKDVNNANTCKAQPVGAGEPNDAFYGGK